MNEAQFRKELRERGYGEAQLMDIKPGPAMDMHAHDQSILTYVVSGEWTLILESETTTFGPGDLCENKVGTMHTERIGPDGVSVLLAKK